MSFANLKRKVDPGITIRNPAYPRWENIGQLDSKQRTKAFYPALSAPLGEYEKYFACPESHIQALTDFLHECNYVLAIGTSARDNDLLELLSEGLPNDVGTIHIVNESRSGAEDTWKRLQEVPQLQNLAPELHTQGFSGFILNEGLERFIGDCSFEYV